MGARIKLAWRITDVDEIEDAEAPRFHLNPRDSTSRAQTTETKVIENRCSWAAVKICPWAQGIALLVSIT
jgi:hypothetical protein